MIENNKKVLIFAPFFNTPNHVGGYRIRRVIRWFEKKQFDIFVVSLGDNSSVVKKDWGTNIIIHSTVLNLLGKFLSIGLKFYPIKIIYILIKLGLKIISIPDEELIWAKKVAKDKNVIKIGKNVDFYFSSSPLESAHIPSYILSKLTGKPIIIDMRDGWLDESLKADYLDSITLRKKIEIKREFEILSLAKTIFVTSENWKNLLISRYPSFNEKIFVLTNAYPKTEIKLSKKKKNNHDLTLFYTGRFSGSRKTQKASYLFEPFEKYIDDRFGKINIKIFGDMHRVDLQELKSKKLNSKNKNYSFTVNNSIPQNELFLKYSELNGLLLLSATHNAIPVKIFEYILTKKPILAITYKYSSVWQIASELPQFFLYDLEGNITYNKKNTEDFLMACSSGEFKSTVPEKYSEDYLENIFFKGIENVIGHLPMENNSSKQITIS